MLKSATLCALLTTLLITGCASSPEHTVEINERTRCKPLLLTQGQELHLSLPSDPTTGYRWKLENTVPSVLKSLGPEVFSSSDESEDGIGSAGLSSWRFQATQLGATELKLQYQQPWDANSTPKKAFTCRIEVK
ncbi:peptidase inhibitor I42 [Pseudomonas luteola]|uniref:protease inhibitor I42 family protein n=1 Tax=Pseudomonas luteola TaxID=47886 RepID=UPI00388FE2B1